MFNISQKGQNTKVRHSCGKNALVYRVQVEMDPLARTNKLKKKKKNVVGNFLKGKKT